MSRRAPRGTREGTRPSEVGPEDHRKDCGFCWSDLGAVQHSEPGVKV